MTTPKALYIHIPFCEKICNYCDFCKVYKGIFDEEKYVDCLLNELSSLKIDDFSLETIYIGGGTPSCLNKTPMIKLLETLYKHFPNVKEFTIEANPESLTDEKLKIFKRYGVNRISLGVESSNDTILKLLNRNHTKKDVIDAVDRIKKHNFKNFNLDFIYGMPNQTIDMVDEDINFALMCNPTHLSFYSLQIEEGTVFYNQKIDEASQDLYFKMYQLIKKRLADKKYMRYEVSNFALKGYESKHNLTYWHDEQYYAIGISASGYISNIRYKNSSSIINYLKGEYKRETNKISEKDEEFEFLMLNLRLKTGFKLKNFSNRFKKDFLTTYSDKIVKVREYLHIDKSRVYIKPSKLYTMDAILLELL